MPRRRHSQPRLTPFEVIAQFGWPLLILLAAAFALGGGGVGKGLQNLAVQLFALGVILFTPGLLREFVQRAPAALIVLVALTILLPLTQLIPLPPAVWQALPGREMAIQSRELVGSGGGWFPFTLDRARTVTALLALFGPIAILLAYRGQDEAAGRRALAILALLALINFLFGALQFAAGDALNFYGSRAEGRFYGFFANHNSSGLVMLIGLLALIGYYQSRSHDALRTVIILFGGLMLVLGVVLTNSRSSTTMLIFPLIWIAWIGLTKLRGVEARKRWIYLAGVAVVIAALSGLALTNDRLGATWARYGDLEDSRPYIWEDTRSGIERYWPLGAGMGTFDEVFQVEESLESLVTARAGRAHNEYLEVLLEAGAVGALVLLGWICFLLFATARRIRTVHAPVTMAASLGLLCIGLQAVVDLPMRNMTVLCVAGLLVALLTAPWKIKRDRVIV